MYLYGKKKYILRLHNLNAQKKTEKGLPPQFGAKENGIVASHDSRKGSSAKRINKWIKIIFKNVINNILRYE